MPYRSIQQSKFIHAKAAEGVPWAKKFVKDAHGTHVAKKVKRVKRRVRRHHR